MGIDGIANDPFQLVSHSQSADVQKFGFASCGRDGMVKLWTVDCSSTNQGVYNVYRIIGIGKFGGELNLVVWRYAFPPKISITCMEIHLLYHTAKLSGERSYIIDVYVIVYMYILAESASVTLIVKLAGHDGPVHSCHFHPTKRLLASASTDHSVIIWNLVRDSLARTRLHTLLIFTHDY